MPKVMTNLMEARSWRSGIQRRLEFLHVFNNSLLATLIFLQNADRSPGKLQESLKSLFRENAHNFQIFLHNFRKMGKIQKNLNFKVL